MSQLLIRVEKLINENGLAFVSEPTVVSSIPTIHSEMLYISNDLANDIWTHFKIEENSNAYQFFKLIKTDILCWRTLDKTLYDCEGITETRHSCPEVRKSKLMSIRFRNNNYNNSIVDINYFGYIIRLEYYIFKLDI